MRDLGSYLKENMGKQKEERIMFEEKYLAQEENKALVEITIFQEGANIPASRVEQNFMRGSMPRRFVSYVPVK